MKHTDHTHGRVVTSHFNRAVETARCSAFGKDWFDVREGEASIFKPEGNGYKPVALLQAADWGKLAQSMN